MNDQAGHVMFSENRGTGVIHVGANIGQEQGFYGSFELDVLWFEPIPSVFNRLKERLGAEPKQKAYRYAVTDEDDKMYPFYITSNDGCSSSLLPLDEHRIEFPHMIPTETIFVQGITLNTFFKRNDIDAARYQALVLDTQGTELKVLYGATDLLPHIKFIEVEVADFEAYKGCARLEEMQTFMVEHEFAEKFRVTYPTDKHIGNYYEIVYGK